MTVYDYRNFYPFEQGLNFRGIPCVCPDTATVPTCRNLLYKRNLICYSALLESRRGEIGIHDRLKIYWGQLRKGSSPFAGMFIGLLLSTFNY